MAKRKVEQTKRKVGRPYKQININVKEFMDMIKFIKEHPIDRTKGCRGDEVPIPETGRAYWNGALDQVLECLNYIHNATPMTSARKVLHDKKLEVYDGDDRVAIYEYIRTQIIEQNGGSVKIYE
jgi:hypothetical protein